MSNDTEKPDASPLIQSTGSVTVSAELFWRMAQHCKDYGYLAGAYWNDYVRRDVLRAIESETGIDPDDFHSQNDKVNHKMSESECR